MADSHIWKGCGGNEEPNVLTVGEAPEPSEIRYEDVHTTFNLKVSQQSYTFSIGPLRRLIRSVHLNCFPPLQPPLRVHTCAIYNESSSLWPPSPRPSPPSLYPTSRITSALAT